MQPLATFPPWPAWLTWPSWPTWLAVLAYLAGLAITLVLAAYLTPPRWWRRPNARALLILAAGGWGIGSLLLHLAGSVGPGLPPPLPLPAMPALAATAPALATPPAAPPASSDPQIVAGQPFQVHRDLNLRNIAGVHGARLATVPAGASVTPTGARDGDWWQVRAEVNGRQRTGWVSSLWLRRSGE